MDDYRKTYIATNNEETTAYGYSVIENHIKRFFESTGKNPRVDKITSTTIDQYYRYLAGLRTKRLPNGMGANTIIKHNNYLHQLFNYAKKHVDVYGIRINPVEDFTPPKRQKARTPDLKAYNTDKIEEMIKCLDENNDIALKAAVLVALFVGTRRGETSYLKWSKIDLQAKRIQIEGSRTCANKIITKPYYPRWASRKFSEFLEKYNFPHIRYHDLRHLNVSILLIHMPVTDVSAHLGHCNVNTTTRIYAHSLLKEKNKVADTLNDMFKVG